MRDTGASGDVLALVGVIGVGLAIDAAALIDEPALTIATIVLCAGVGAITSLPARLPVTAAGISMLTPR